MHGRMVFWLMVYSFAIFIKISKEQWEKYPECLEKSLVGKERNLNIPDSSYRASSYYKSPHFPNDVRYKPHNAKLNGKYGWAPKQNDNPADYLQIDLGTPRVITAVATQGNGGDPGSVDFKNIYEWVENYTLSFTNNTKSWKRYGHKVKGNDDQTNVVRHDFKTPITAQYIRFIPLDCHKAKTMRVNVYVSIEIQVMAYSQDLRWRIMFLKYGHNRSPQNIARYLNVFLSTVFRIIRQFRRTGDVLSLRKNGRPAISRLLTRAQMLILCEFVLRNGTTYFRELSDHLEETTGSRYSAQSLCRLLKRCGYSRKRIHRVALQKRIELTEEFLQQLT